MRTLVEAIVANLDHYGQMLAEETIPVKELSEVLGVEIESEVFKEIQQLTNEIRQDLGGASIKSKRLRRLLKYGRYD